MKVALCLSGHMRKFTHTFPALHKYVIQPYQCDVFIHTWDVLGYTCAYKSDGSLDRHPVSLSQINALYNPKKIIVDSTDFVNELLVQAKQYAPHLINIPKPVSHMAGMFYKIYAANELKNFYEIESGIKYDCVIRCRPDLMFLHPLDMEKNLKHNTIYIPRHISGHMWYTDQFAYGTPESMDLYSSLYFDIPSYFRQGGEYFPERFMEWGLRHKKLNAEMRHAHFDVYR